MVDTSQVVALVVAVSLGMVFLGVVAPSVADNSGTVAETDNVTADVGNFTELSGYDLVSGSETVSDGGDGTEYSAGTDYEVNESDGSLKALSGGAINDSDELKVSYQYNATGDLAATVLDFVPVMLGLILFVALGRRVQGGM